MEMLAFEQEPRSNPLDLLEEMVGANGWPFERCSDTELMIEVAGQWCDYTMCFLWQAEVAAVLFSCHFEHKVPQAKRPQVNQLLAAINETLWLGHFELTAEEGVPLFRHTVPLRGLRGASVEQFEDLLDTAVVECERFYPALQLVVWAGRPVADALQCVALEPQGEA
ncbi:MAG: YbjN domain-containing protein [Kiloniellales bacterium]|nr:YbjN domain-containing protein [Kiloniellales bacterium]